MAVVALAVAVVTALSGGFGGSPPIVTATGAALAAAVALALTLGAAAAATGGGDVEDTVRG